MVIFLVFVYWNRKLRIVNSELEFQKNKAQEALKVKSNFLANMSHEIRTPINVILSMTYLVQKETQDKKQQEQLHNIEKATTSLLRLINDILDSSKIEVGKLNIVKNNFNMDQVLNNVQAVAEANIEAKDINFEIHYDKILPKYFNGDSLRLEQVLINLVSNATKFTQKGLVQLSIENIGYNRYRFSVSDTGIGVKQEQIENIFEPFTQADDTITREYGGTGLGLSISKQLVELMGGTLRIESKVKEGTQIYFDLELKEVNQEDYIKEEGLENTKKKIELNLYNKRKTIVLEKEKELLEKLEEAVLRKRPNVVYPIIDELDKYNLQILSSEDFKNIKIYIKRYMFHEASEILNKYEK